MNKVILIGNLTKDPELNTTSNGISVCRFSIAVPRKYTNAEGERETDFINVVVWRNLADNCHKYLKKGSKAAVVGNIQSRNYDANDGTKRFVTEVIAEEVEFVSTKNNQDNSNAGDGAGAEVEKVEPAKKVAKLEPIDDDQLPF